MDTQFIAIVQKLLTEQGKDTPNNTSRFKSFLADYTGTEYKKECRLLMQAIEAGVAKAISSTQELAICKKQQVRMLHEEYFITEEAAVGVVDMLGLVLKGDTSRTHMPGKTGKSAAVPEKGAPSGMVWIAGGTFLMGSPSSEVERWDSEGPQRQVTISKGFSMGKYAVTQKEWRELMGTTINQQSAKGTYHTSLHGVGDNCPMYYVSWYDAVKYCNRRSVCEGLTSAYMISRTNVTWNKSANGYRLPTEAEWEYACRAETTSPFSTGSNITTSQANYDGNYPYNDNAKGTYREKATAIGSFAANAWGLYDMHGNVLEWCWDRYGNYSSGSQTDPSGATSGVTRVIRGGSWSGFAGESRSAFRSASPPSNRDNKLGFRLVRP